MKIMSRIADKVTIASVIERFIRSFLTIDKIVELKKQNKDTTELEKELDEMIYILYELTTE